MFQPISEQINAFLTKNPRELKINIKLLITIVYFYDLKGI